jgi:DNA-directed RNA polymerase specialized sigma24 family protein
VSTDACDAVLDLLPTSDLLPTHTSDATTLDLKISIRQLSRPNQAILSMWLAGWTQQEIGAMFDLTQQAISLRMIDALTQIGMEQ